jgi:quercetin dioxygenase-like cupin family protein
METWDLAQLDVQPHKPQVVSSQRGAARVIVLHLPAGEELQDHEVHEHAWLHVHDGAVDVQAGEETVRGEAGFLAHFAPQERHEVRAVQDARLLLVLAPWPGDGHPGATD